MKLKYNVETPVILLGGHENALSIARSLGKRGIHITAIAREGSPVHYSKYCNERIVSPSGEDFQQALYRRFLSGQSHFAQGSVIFPCCDNSIQFVADQRDVLEQQYLLDIHSGALQKAMLNKQQTLDLARKAGCPIPQYWDASNLDDIGKLKNEIQFPVLIKPYFSHLFQEVFNKKVLVVESHKELMNYSKEVLDANLGFMICEMIPGPDTLLSSYYTHIDNHGEKLFEFTKRVIRRSPPNFGGGCYHITEWLPETAKMGERFFQGMGFTGLGNVEFKLDLRDNQLKIIECNARFTAAQELLARSGMDISWLIYCFLTGNDHARISSYREQVRLWYPEKDFDSFRRLRQTGKLSLWGWIKSLLHPQVLPYFNLGDMRPFWFMVKKLITHRLIPILHKRVKSIFQQILPGGRSQSRYR